MMFTTNFMSLRAHSFYWWHCFIKPALCVSFSLIYFHTNVLFLYAAQSDFWAERRKAVEAFKNQNNTAFNPAVPNPNTAIPKLLAQLPALQTSLSVIATTGLIGGKQTQVTPSHEIATSPLATRNDNHKTNAITLKHYNSITPSFSSITPYAEIKEIYTPSLDPGPVGNGFKPFPTVVIIQDVHQHYEAQKNISFILQRIVEAQRNDTEQQESVIASIAKQSQATGNREIATSPLATRNDDPRVVVGLEGAVGPFGFSPYRAYSDKKLTADIADFFMKEGMIGGPEFYGITTPDNQLMPMVGVEDEKLYLDNIQAFKDSLPLEKQVKIEVEIKKQEIKVKKEKIFNKSLLELDRKREAYHEDKLGLGDYLTALVSEVNGSRRLQPAQIKVRRINPAATTKIYPSVYLLVEAYQIEKSLDFTKVDKERARIIEVLSEKLSKARLNELAQVSLAYRTGNITYAQFYAIFKAMAQDAGINFDVFPEMSQYIKYVLLTDKIDKNRLFDEIIQLEESLENHLAKTPEEKQLLAQSKYLELVKKLVEFSLTPEEWKQYLQYRSRESEDRSQDNDKSPFHPPFLKGERGGLSLSLKPFEQFYETALQRNRVLVENLLGQVESETENGRVRQVKNETGKGKEQGSRRLQPAHSMERRINPATTNLPALNSNSSFSTFASTCRFSVLVAGGFHTQGLTQILKQKNVPYVVLTPNITKVEEGQQSLELLARGKTPLEKLFSGEKIFLVAPLKAGITRKLSDGYDAASQALKFALMAIYLALSRNRKQSLAETNKDTTQHIDGGEEKDYGLFKKIIFKLTLNLGPEKSRTIRIAVIVFKAPYTLVENLPTYKKEVLNKLKEVFRFDKIGDEDGASGIIGVENPALGQATIDGTKAFIQKYISAIAQTVKQLYKQTAEMIANRTDTLDGGNMASNAIGAFAAGAVVVVGTTSAIFGILFAAPVIGAIPAIAAMGLTSVLGVPMAVNFFSAGIRIIMAFIKHGGIRGPDGKLQIRKLLYEPIAETYPINKNGIPVQISRFTFPFQALTNYHKNSIFLHEGTHLQGYGEFIAHLLQGLYFPWVTFQVFLANAFPWLLKQQNQQPYRSFLNTIPPIDVVADNILSLPSQIKNLSSTARYINLRIWLHIAGIGSRQQDKLREGREPSSDVQVSENELINNFKETYFKEMLPCLYAPRLRFMSLGIEKPTVVTDSKFYSIVVNTDRLKDLSEKGREDEVYNLIVLAAIQTDILRKTGYYETYFLNLIGKFSRKLLPQLGHKIIYKNLVKVHGINQGKALLKYRNIPIFDLSGIAPEGEDKESILREYLSKVYLPSINDSGLSSDVYLEAWAGVITATFHKELEERFVLIKNKFPSDSQATIWELLALHPAHDPFVKAMEEDPIWAEISGYEYSNMFRYKDIYEYLSEKTISEAISKYKSTGEQQVINIGIIGAAYGQEIISFAIIFEKMRGKLTTRYNLPDNAVAVQIHVVSLPTSVFKKLESNRIYYSRDYIASHVTKEELSKYFESDIQDKRLNRLPGLNRLFKFYGLDLLDKSTYKEVPQLDGLLVNNVLQYLRRRKNQPLDKFEVTVDNAFDYMNAMLKKDGILSISNGNDDYVRKKYDQMLADLYVEDDRNASFHIKKISAIDYDEFIIPSSNNPAIIKKKMEQIEVGILHVGRTKKAESRKYMEVLSMAVRLLNSLRNELSPEWVSQKQAEIEHLINTDKEYMEAHGPEYYSQPITYANSLRAILTGADDKIELFTGWFKNEITNMFYFVNVKTFANNVLVIPGDVPSTIHSVGIKHGDGNAINISPNGKKIYINGNKLYQDVSAAVKSNDYLILEKYVETIVKGVLSEAMGLQSGLSTAEAKEVRNRILQDNPELLHALPPVFAEQQHGAGVIPAFQQAWQKFVQLKPINWLFPNFKYKDYRTKIAPGLEETIFMLLGIAGIGIAYVLGVDISTLWLVGINALSRLGFVLAHWIPGNRAPPKDRRAAIQIGLANFLITSAPLLLSLPVINVPLSITLLLSLTALWPAIRWHTLVNRGDKINGERAYGLFSGVAPTHIISQLSRLIPQLLLKLSFQSPSLSSIVSSEEIIVPQTKQTTPPNTIPTLAEGSNPTNGSLSAPADSNNTPMLPRNVETNRFLPLSRKSLLAINFSLSLLRNVVNTSMVKFLQHSAFIIPLFIILGLAPDAWAGTDFVKLAGVDWVNLVPLILSSIGIGYLAWHRLVNSGVFGLFTGKTIPAEIEKKLMSWKYSSGDLEKIKEALEHSIVNGKVNVSNAIPALRLIGQRLYRYTPDSDSFIVELFSHLTGFETDMTVYGNKIVLYMQHTPEQYPEWLAKNSYVRAELRPIEVPIPVHYHGTSYGIEILTEGALKPQEHKMQGVAIGGIFFTKAYEPRTEAEVFAKHKGEIDNGKAIVAFANKAKELGLTGWLNVQNDEQKETLKEILNEISPTTLAKNGEVLPIVLGFRSKIHDLRFGRSLSRPHPLTGQNGGELSEIGFTNEEDMKLFISILLESGGKLPENVALRIRNEHEDMYIVGHNLTNLVNEIEATKRQISELEQFKDSVIKKLLIENDKQYETDSPWVLSINAFMNFAILPNALRNMTWKEWAVGLGILSGLYGAISSGLGFPVMGIIAVFTFAWLIWPEKVQKTVFTYQGVIEEAPSPTVFGSTSDLYGRVALGGNYVWSYQKLLTFDEDVTITYDSLAPTVNTVHVYVSGKDRIKIDFRRNNQQEQWRIKDVTLVHETTTPQGKSDYVWNLMRNNTVLRDEAGKIMMLLTKASEKNMPMAGLIIDAVKEVIPLQIGDTIPITKFILGGQNDEEAIKSLRKWRLYEMMVKRLRPGQMGLYGSEVGFLGQDQDLVDILLQDYKTVRNLGVSKDIMAQWIEDVLGHRNLDEIVLPNGEHGYLYNGQKLWVGREVSRGMQGFPLPGPISGAKDEIVIENVGNGSRILVTEMHPDLISVYGFFEGAGHYRASPEEIVKVFMGDTGSPTVKFLKHLRTALIKKVSISTVILWFILLVGSSINPVLVVAGIGGLKSMTASDDIFSNESQTDFSKDGALLALRRNMHSLDFPADEFFTSPKVQKGINFIVKELQRAIRLRKGSMEPTRYMAINEISKFLKDLGNGRLALEELEMLGIDNSGNATRSFFGKDFSWEPVIGTLYRIGLANVEVREAFLGALRNMGLEELAEQIEGVWGERGKGEEFIALLNPFMASYEVAKVVIEIVWKERGDAKPIDSLGKALKNIAGIEKADEIMNQIIAPLAELGLQPTDIVVVKSLNPHPALSLWERVRTWNSLFLWERGRGEGKGFDHTFMTFTRDIKGRLKIFIGEDVLKEALDSRLQPAGMTNSGKLEEFLKISLLHEILESSGLTHRQVEQAGFKLNDTKTANKSIEDLIKLAKKVAIKNGVGIEARSFAKIRDSIANELDKIIPGIKNNLVSVFDQKLDVPDTDKENYRSLAGALHLLRMADIFRGDASARHSVKVGEIKWDAETAPRAAWYMSSDEFVDLMDTYQNWHGAGKFDQEKPTRKSSRKVRHYNDALTSYAVKFFETNGTLNANPGLPGTGMNVDKAIQVFQKKIRLLTNNKKFKLTDKQEKALKDAWELGENEARSLEKATPKDAESLIKEQTGAAMLGLFEVSALSENTLSQMYGILKLAIASKGLAKDVVLPLITNKDAIDEDAIKQALIEMAKKDDDMGKENMEEALKTTHFGKLKITRADLAERLGIDPELLVEIDTETVYEMVQEWADANKGKLRFSKRYGPVQVFTETPNHWKKSWREDIKLTILAIISATQVVKVDWQTDEHLKLIKQLNIQA